jgi:hypothetical protein
MLACDFLTVETAFIQRIYVLFFISLATRRLEFVACTSNPDGGWVAQQARNLILQLGDAQPLRFLVHDRDTKFTPAFDEVFHPTGHVSSRPDEFQLVRAWFPDQGVPVPVDDSPPSSPGRVGRPPSDEWSVYRRHFPNA